MNKNYKDLSKKQKKRFIVFEGCDGAGKSTISNSVYKALIARNVDCVRSFEPGGSVIADQIRKVFAGSKNTGSENISLFSELMLVLASRNQHVNYKIIPALLADKVVLCDRFTDSTRIYQGLNENFDIDNDVFEYLLDKASEQLSAYLTVVLTADAQTLNKRTSSRANQDNNQVTGGENSIARFDNKDLNFYQKINTAYKNLAKKKSMNISDLANDENYLLIHSELSVQQITDKVIKCLADNDII